MSGVWTWEQMLDEFRALGGVADNVCRRQGPNGWGLYPIDPLQPVCVRAPDNLLLPVGLVIVDGGALRIKRCDAVGEREAAFVERYQAGFSWGAGGRADCTAFVEAMDGLPERIRRVLTEEFGLARLFAGTAAERVQKRFFGSRCINMLGKPTMMPVVELVNHATAGASYDMQDGVSVHGTFAGEVLARYGRVDPLACLVGWGFVSPEPRAYSLPALLSLNSRVLAVRRVFVGRAKEPEAPRLTLAGKVVEIPLLQLGNRAQPHEPRRIFLQLMERAEIANAGAAFDEILQLNRARLQRLMAALESQEGTVARLREACRLQLAALSAVG